MRLLLPFLVFTLLTATVQAQEGQLRLDPESLKGSEAQLSKIIEDAVTKANGNWETNAIHWVLAFKTGYFKDDPVRADAAREVASKLIQNAAVAGDRVSARAFEFGLWEYKNASETTFNISSSAAIDSSKTSNILELFPLTPKAGSLGGHDLERAAVELGNEFSNDSDAVIVMLLNSAASQGAANEQLMGSNAPEYQALLERWQRLPGTKDGATLEMPFKVIQPKNAPPVEVKLAVVVFVPKTFSSVGLSAGTRSELLSSVSTATAVDPSTNTSNDFPWWLLVIPLAIGAFFAVRRLLGSNTQGSLWTLELLETTPTDFSLADAKNGGTIVVVAGAGYSNESGDRIATHPKAPAVSTLVRFLRSGNAVKIDATGSSLELKTFNNNVVIDTVTVKPDANALEQTLEFQGEIISSTGIPRSTTVTLRFRIVKS